jgi:methionine-gamma-lyase
MVRVGLDCSLKTARVAMVKPFPSKTHIGNHMLHPETLMLNYGYDPQLSEGAVKPPVFLTFDFVFRTTEDGKDFFDYVAGRREPPEGMGAGLVYSRFNHPNSEIVEDRLAVYERCGVLRVVLVRHVGDCDHDPRVRAARRRYPAFAAALWRDGNPVCEDACGLSIGAVGFCRRHRRSRGQAGCGGRHAQGPGCDDFIETPANPTNGLVDIAMVRRVADMIGQAQGHTPIVACDNTLLGRCFSGPIEHGADLSLYSLTKYIGGHSDLIAGAALGSKALMKDVKALRGAIGTQLDPHSCWMLSRSLETLSIRMEKSRQKRAARGGLSARPRQGGEVHYLAHHEALRRRPSVREAMHRRGLHVLVRHRRRPGRRFKFLNALQIFKLAVSLGGTESLASLPASMTHSGVPADIRQKIGVLDSTIRLSIGIEHPSDLIADITQALNAA